MIRFERVQPIVILSIVIVSVSNAPYFIWGRRLNVRVAQDLGGFNEQYMDSAPVEPPAPAPSDPFPEDNLVFGSTDSSAMYDDGNYDDLVSLHDDLEANLECLKIQHQHEIRLLEERLSREKKLRDEAEEAYKVAEGDWEKTLQKNLQTRENLIKNTMQTFNIRRSFARRIKEQATHRLSNGIDRA